MNFQPHRPKGGLHRAVRLLSLLLIQHALVPTSKEANARTRLPENSGNNPVSDSDSRPYLKVAGSIPLRFSAPPRPMPILTTKMAAATSTTSLAIAPIATESSVATTTLTPAIESKNQPNDPTAGPPSPTTVKPAGSILPDNTSQSTRPEDFLPFFQFPAGGDVTVAVPVRIPSPPPPGQLPASSATYQQR